MNYEKLKHDLLKIHTFQLYKDVEIVSESYMYRNTYTPASSFYAEQADIRNLAAQLIHFFMVVYKNFEFVDFYDKNFIDLVKALIKDPEEFNNFLSMVDIDVELFIKLMVYISPQAFTSNLVKFIQKTYLGIEPVGKKIQKRVK